MKEFILTALKAKFPGVNANILGRVADMLAKTATTEEEATTAVAGVTKDYIDVIEAYGDSRATDAQKTAVQNYESKHGLKDGVKVEKKTEAADDKKTKPAGSDDAPDWAKALIESNKQLTERLNRMEGERTAADRKAAFDGIISKLPDTLRKGYSRISVDKMTDEEFSTLKDEVTAEVEAINKEAGARGAVFGKPTVGGGKKSGSQSEATDAEASAVVDKLRI